MDGPRFARLLYMATLVATRRNPILRAFYERLCALRKPKHVLSEAEGKVALTYLYSLAASSDPVLVPDRKIADVRGAAVAVGDPHLG